MVSPAGVVKKTHFISYYPTLIKNRFEKFITRNGIFMSAKNREMCILIAKNFVKMTNLMS